MDIKKRKAMIAIGGFGAALATPEEAFRKLQLACESLKEDKLPEAFKVFEKDK